MLDATEAALASRAWPFEEARRLLKRFESRSPDNGKVLFQTGYGPSGLPHIGTFGEVVRTTMVRKAFETISDISTRLICFSDDMDGFRKVPANLPNPEQLAEDLDLPLTSVRDPFGTHESFAHHNNARLRAFLDDFGFEYEFASATDYYRRGVFDDMLLTVLARFDEVMAIMLPSLGKIAEGRRESYSPFLPISPRSGRVLQVPTLERDVERGTIVYAEPDGEKIRIPVTGGNVKLQWKPDWAMRWAALRVDYEMYGKDLIPSAELGKRICNLLGHKSPVGMSFELFLDESGQKISKSKGKSGMSVEEWLSYASPESLGLFMYQKPKTAKRLFFDIIPKNVDEYHQHLRAFENQDSSARFNNPVWHIHAGEPPRSGMIVTYAMLLNLASVVSAENSDVLWGFMKRYAPEATPETHPDLAAAVESAVRYFKDRIAPFRKFRAAEPREATALRDLASELSSLEGTENAEELQSLVYAVGKKHQFEPLRGWFRAIYEVLLGASQGPRFGGFIVLYGIPETVDLIEQRLEKNSQA